MTMDSTKVLTGEDFHDKFDPVEYFEMYRHGFSAYCTGLPQFFLKHFHEAFSTLPSSGLSVLDFGSGPTVLGAISAAPRAEEIVLSDYTENNRVAAEKWLRGEPSDLDWTAYFRYVIQDLEGLGSEKIKEREESIRSTVKAVVPCDINKDPPIEEGYFKQYDVVICCLVLECATQTRDDYEAGMGRLAKLVKPGGSLLFVGVVRSAEAGFYKVGGNKFRSVGVSFEFAVNAMEKVGFSDVKQERLPAKNEDESVLAYIFMKGKKL